MAGGGCVETISERHLLAVLEAMLHQIPFLIRGFHCDNGSEFINHQVAGLLEKLRVEFTKSRAYRTTDNALVEGKNGAVIRKHIGHGPIAAEHAEAFPEVLHGAFESVSEFPPSLRICHHPDRLTPPSQTCLSGR
jgi:transposase InsO family protein